MDTKTFIGKLLPAQDNYVLYLSKSETSKWNENFVSLDEVCEAIAKYDATPTTVYFAVGKFANNVELSPKTGRPSAKRRKEFATRFQTLACDIDVGGSHTYQTQKEATLALFTACQTLSLPIPMIVSSGKGVHAYWPLTASISANLWEKMSVVLRTALQANNVDIDASKIHDTSMVLRPAGSHHKKDPANWVEVRVVHDEPASDPQVIADALLPYKSAATTLKNKANKRTSSIMSSVLEGGTPLKLDDLRKCKQIDALVLSGGKLDAMGRVVVEPLWRASLGIAKFCGDQQEAITRLAGGHPDFDLDNNMQKLAGWRGTGPTNCSTFKQLCESGCDGCKHEGKMTSPAQLSGGVTEITVPDPVSGDPTSVKLPPRYHFKNNAVLYTPAGSDEDVFVSPYIMYVVSRYSDEEENRQVAKVAVQFPLEGTRVIDLDVPTIRGGGADFGKALALKQVYTYGDNRALQQYLMTYLQELQKADTIEYYFKHYGWQKNGSFLGCEGIVGRPADTHIHYDGQINEYRNRELGKKGELSAWVSGTRLFSHPELGNHGTVFLMMAGAPLLIGSGIAGMFVNMYSKESGTGKTLTARYGMSIWGNPDRLGRVVNDTDNALYRHFGILNSVGAYIDEITTMESERLRKFVFTLQEGREKDRLKQTTDGFRDKVYWNMPVFGSSNRDVYESLGMNYSSEAEKLRVLQFNFSKNSVFDDGDVNIGYTVSKFLSENHGLAGNMIIEEIIRRGGPKAVYEKAHDRFEYKYNFKFHGNERFIKAGFVIADAVNDIMQDLGIIKFDGEAKIRHSLGEVLKMRDNATEGAMSGLDLGMQFLTENAGRIVHYREIRHKLGDKNFVIEPTPQSAVARTEVAYDNGTLVGGYLYINKQMLKKWCHLNGAEYRSIVVGLLNEGVKVTDNVRCTIYKGVAGAASSGQTYCLRLDISSHPRLIEANSDTNPSPLNCTPRLAALL